MTSFSAINRAGSQSVWWFSIGIQQWGSFVTVSKAYNAVLLLEYQTWYCPLITVQQAATEMIGYNNLQLNNFNITLGYGDASERTGLYLCLGIQQWGYQAVHGNAEQEFSLPIAFTNNPYTVAISTTNTGNHAACKGFTLSTIILAAGDSVNVDDNIGFIILGKQQWGIYTGANNPATQNLPINATQNIILALASMVENEALNGNMCVYISNTTAASITLLFDWDTFDYTATVKSAAYWVICIQQWGLSTGRTITYPVSISTLYSIVAIDSASGMDAVQVCDVNTANNTSAIIFQMRLTQGDILPDNMTGFYWILIGKAQQWRMLEIEATEQNVLFPIPFTQWCVASGSRVTGTGGNPTTLGANAAFHQIATLTHATVFSVEAQEYYLFVAGVQQWGYIQTHSSTNIVNLNVPYTSTHYACFAQKADTKAGNSVEAWAAVTAISLTDFTLRAHYDNTNYFLSFGKQRSGVSLPLKLMLILKQRSYLLLVHQY